MPSSRLSQFSIAALSLLVSSGCLMGAEKPGASPGEQIAAIETRLGARLGVSALETAGGRRLEHRSDERFALCSTFKFLAVAAVLHRVEQKELRLEQLVRYTRADLLEYAPITTKHVEEGRMSLEALCSAAMTYSDNTAANLILKVFGGPPAVTAYARSLGDEKTRLDRVEPFLNDVRPGDPRDTTTPAAMVRDLRLILLGDALSAESKERLENWMRANTTGEGMIRAGMPTTWKIGDKTGRSRSGAINDIAIARPPGGAPILLAIYCGDSKASLEDRKAAFAEIARLVMQSFSK